MYYKKWKKVFADKELIKVCEIIQYDFIQDYFNENDYAVGIFPIGKINQSVVDDLNEYEGMAVIDWEEDYVLLEVDEKFLIEIELVKTGKDCDNSDIYEWEITYAKRI